MAATGGGTLPAVMARAVPGPAAIPTGAMAAAEAAAAEVVRRVQPTEASERRRAEVIDYARRIVGTALGCEVFAFGSVPLKTYLPDGDIDLTVLGNASCDSTLIDDVYCILGSGEQNSDAEFEVKDLEHIDAEVKLIKCTIENIIVDISFNQTGGICALCFLELVDRKIGKNHLFKRSIILIKAWCYYESRLLGAHHGLISTYALETLILYIFNLFHKSLHGPLEVLYRFLEYFSKFDWDNYCISLNGPVALSSLPNLIVEGTNIPVDDLLFDKEFLHSSVEKASVPPRDSDARCTKFRVKHLNIIDPLKECNNLGRSVNKANFSRIRTAFSYGARKLGQYLMLPSERISGEIFGFFKNTLKRNGRGVRADIGHDGALNCQPLLGPEEELLDNMLSMQICYKENENQSRHHVSKRLANNGLNVKIDVPTQDGRLPGVDKSDPSTDLSTKSNKRSYVYQENGNGCSEQYYVDHEMEGRVSHCTAEAVFVDDKSLMKPQVHVNNSSDILNSVHASDLRFCKPAPAYKSNWSAFSPRVENQNLPAFSLSSLPDLSGDLDSQLRCLRQVQYHLEYLFDEFCRYVQGSCGSKVDKGLFNIPTHSIVLNTDMTLRELLIPSSTETDGRKLSPASSHSTGDISQQSQEEDHWGMAFQLNVSGTDVPSNGLSPSSYHAYSESSVPRCHRSEGIPNLHGTCTYIYEKHIASLGEKGTMPINQQIKVKHNQASVPKGSFVPYKEQSVLDRGQSLKIQDGLNGYIRSGRKNVDKQIGHTRKEFTKPHCEERHIRGYHGDACLNRNKIQKQSYDADLEFARPGSAMKQIPKHQPSEVQETPDECTHINNLARKQSHNTRKGHEVLDRPTNRRPICETPKLQSSLRGRSFSKFLGAKQKHGNHGEHLSFARDTEHIANCQVVNVTNGLSKEVNPIVELVGNGSKSRPLLPNVMISHESGSIQRMHLASNASQPSFTITKGYSQSEPLETQPDRIIEFGSLGPFSLTVSSPKSSKAPNKHCSSKACGDAEALVLQSYRAGATQSR
ncbi:uncharacterized protein LOC100823912 isoform X3 [Brachypodium distachyon]|nr:uncharacterized protein LOC100823912 isoform X3 [Brachypodium distachyon]|eukprot:XP_024312840.1 uncharacterized protein LOC100823912 isoform X3 [Brachypodium distachyon]